MYPSPSSKIFTKMNQCPYCQTEILNERYNFCANAKCKRQVKCKSCREILEPHADICLVCGSPVKQIELSQNQMNQFILEEKQTTTSYSRRVEAKCSDNAVVDFTAVLSGIPKSSATPKEIRISQPLSEKLLPTFEIGKEMTDESNNEGDFKALESSSNTSPTNQDSYEEQALSFFEVNG